MKVEMRIREIRESKKIKLSELAEKANISKSHLSDIERSKKTPSLFVLLKIAVVLGVDERDLYSIHL